jgi:hypothetical protein
LRTGRGLRMLEQILGVRGYLLEIGKAVLSDRQSGCEATLWYFWAASSLRGAPLSGHLPDLCT